MTNTRRKVTLRVRVCWQTQITDFHKQ